MIWQPMNDFPDRGWVFVYFYDGIEYGQAFFGELDIGGTKFNLDEAWCWTPAPKPNNLMEIR